MRFQSITSKIKSSISAKFSLMFLLFLIIPLMIVMQLFITRLHSILKEKERVSVYEKISFTQNQADGLFSEMESIMTSLVLNSKVIDILADPSRVPSYEWYSDYSTLNSQLTFLNSNAGYKYDLTIIRCDESTYYSGGLYNTILNSGSPIITYIRENGRTPVFFNRSLSGFDNQNNISLGRAIYKQDQYLGSILVELPVSYLDQLLTPFESGSTRIYIINQEGEILYSSESVPQSCISPEFKEAVNSHSSTVQLGSQEYLLQQMPMQKENLSVVALVTTDSVFRESSKTTLYFVLALFLIVGIATACIYLLTRAFTRDILALNAAVSQFGDHADTPICLDVRSSDEIGQLTQGVVSMSHRIRLLLHKIQENERHKRILEFNSLQSQINPHMIYNTLNTITYLAEVQNVANIQEISSSFAYLLRSLSNQGEFISIAQEVEYLHSYISIKKYNLLSDIQTDFYVEEEAKNCRILKLILQPIVENAIIHGFSNRLDDCILTVSIKKCGEFLQIQISDNGNGMDEDCIHQILTSRKSHGNTFLRVGIRNIIERLTLQYGDLATFSIRSTPGCGTVVHISFPAQPFVPDTEKEEPYVSNPACR